MSGQGALRFERLHVGHIEALQLIEQVAYTHPWSAQIMRETFKSGTPCLGMLDAEGAIAAYAFVLMAVGEAQILNITVDPKRQGQGLGRRMMEHIRAVAAAEGCTQLLLEVRRSNTVARRLYESLGYQTLGVRKGYYPTAEGREDALVLGYEIL